MIEQPSPTTSPWSNVVEVEYDVEKMVDQQARKGLETYGTPLESFNGRNAYEDALAEMVDAIRYLRQLEDERHRWAWAYGNVRSDIERALEHLLAGRNGDAARVLAHALEYGLP